MSLARHDADVDALVTDRYLEALLAAGDRRASDAPADATLDPSLRATARRLSRELARVHPSFRFEERLAGRLAETAAGMRLDADGGARAMPASVPVTTVRESPARLARTATTTRDAPTRLTRPAAAATAPAAAISGPYAAATSGAVAPAAAAPAAISGPYAAKDMTSGAVAPAAAATAPAATPAATPARATVVARPLLIGGALTSAAIAGAAYVAWRRGRVPTASRLG